ncbi:hypothetical protein H4I96_02204 [Botrytis cinerea]
MPHMKWPPQIKNIQVFGEVKDNPQNDPLTCTYMDENAYQPSFIPHTHSEEEYEKDPQNKEKISRVVNWVFGESLKTFRGKRWHGSTAGKRFGTGVARVQVQPDNSLKVDRLMGDNMLFGENEPHFGMKTYVVGDDGYIYLFGSKDAPSPTLDLKNHWARIRSGSDFTSRENYEFLIHTLDGKSKVWDRSYSLHQLVNLIPVQAQGAIIKVPELAPKDGHIFGPWEEWEGPEIPKFGGGGLRYTLYPHERSCQLENGEMRISWSDDKQMGGMVVQAMLHFATEGENENTAQQSGPSPQPNGGWKDKAKGFLNSLK